MGFSQKAIEIMLLKCKIRHIAPLISKCMLTTPDWKSTSGVERTFLGQWPTTTFQKGLPESIKNIIPNHRNLNRNLILKSKHTKNENHDSLMYSWNSKEKKLVRNEAGRKMRRKQKTYVGKSIPIKYDSFTFRFLQNIHFSYVIGGAKTNKIIIIILFSLIFLFNITQSFRWMVNGGGLSFNFQFN